MALDPGLQQLQNMGLYSNAGGNAGVTGTIGDVSQYLTGLQQQMQSGTLSPTDFYNQVNQVTNALQPSLTNWENVSSGLNSAITGAGGQNIANIGAQAGDINTFAQQFQNLTGKAPTASDISGFLGTVGNQLTPKTSYADVNSMINQYISNADQPQITQYQQGQQQNALNTAQQQAQNLVQQQNQAAVNQLTSPQTMQQIEQGYNQQGLLNSGAFSQGLGNTLANAAASNESNALAGVTIPGINAMQGTSNAPYNSYLSNLNSNLQTSGNQQNALSNFDMQSQLAQLIANMSKPTGLQQWAPIISGGLQGLGNAF